MVYNNGSIICRGKYRAVGSNEENSKHGFINSVQMFELLYFYDRNTRRQQPVVIDRQNFTVPCSCLIDTKHDGYVFRYQKIELFIFWLYTHIILLYTKKEKPISLQPHNEINSWEFQKKCGASCVKILILK